MSKIFPKSANALPLQILIFLGILGGVATAGINYYATPKYTRVGYQPVQPVPFEHSLHAGQLGIDCRYCHSTVEDSSHAAIPPAQTCMNCHSKVWTTSPKLAPIRESYQTGKAVEWVKVHDLPDYAYFNHSAHVTRGIGCVSCHGRVDQMEKVYQHEPLSMGWCLDCHRNPEPNLRPVEEVTNMTWAQPTPEFGKEFREKNHIAPPTDCSTCHR